MYGLRLLYIAAYKEEAIISFVSFVSFPIMSFACWLLVQRVWIIWEIALPEKIFLIRSIDLCLQLNWETWRLYDVFCCAGCTALRQWWCSYNYYHIILLCQCVIMNSYIYFEWKGTISFSTSRYATGKTLIMNAESSPSFAAIEYEDTKSIDPAGVSFLTVSIDRLSFL